MSIDIKQVVKDKYSEAARGVTATKSDASCCGSPQSCCDPITSNLYDTAQTKISPKRLCSPRSVAGTRRRWRT